ncbi:TetR/AcrR family transcriptional regulator [Kocuria rhizophila]|nr:TetR/AcrR family transcriptional regulator [Kocuria rhizophila]
MIRSAPAVFAQQGIDGASVSDLCAAAGFTRGRSTPTSSPSGSSRSSRSTTSQPAGGTCRSQLDHWLARPGRGPVVTRIIEGVTDQVANVDQQALRVELSIAAFRSPGGRRERMAPSGTGCTGPSSRRSSVLRAPTPRVHRAPGTWPACCSPATSGQLTDHVGHGRDGARRPAGHSTMWLAFTRPA